MNLLGEGYVSRGVKMSLDEPTEIRRGGPIGYAGGD